MLCKQHHKSSPLNSTHYAMLYRQNGDRIMAVDFVASLHSSLLAYNRVLEKCCWGPGKSWNFSVTERMGTLDNGKSNKNVAARNVTSTRDRNVLETEKLNT